MTNHQLMESVVDQVVDSSLAGAVMNAYSVCFESEDNRRKNYEDLKDMAIKLLVQGNAFNVMHWNVETNTKHTLLNEAYDLCRDTGDKLAETYMSVTEKSCMPERADLSENITCDESKALSSMKSIKAEMQDVISKNDWYSEGIKNIFADFDETITSIIYKYQQFNA